MSHLASKPGRIALDYTVPSQDDQYLQARRLLEGESMIRRKRSLSQDDEDHEEGDDDDEYIPHKDERAYPGQQYQSDASMGRGNERDVHRFGATSASAGTGGRKPQKSVVLGPDGQPPPKKKRRRQALSCTECKRRKIRCDRAQPCAPCTRRGEGDKCKWNILEPVEKFVTRKEYDEIKDSLSRLETILSTTGGSGSGTSEEVAAAVNIVKSKAVLLGKVISSTSAQQSASTSTTGGQFRGGSGTNGVNASNPVPHGTGSVISASKPGIEASRIGLIDGASGGAAPFYQGFTISVPSQGQEQQHLGQGEEEHFTSSRQQRALNLTPTTYSRSPLVPSHSPLVPSPDPSQHLSQYPSASTLRGHYLSGYSQQQQRMPQINLGDLVVEDQSGRYGTGEPSSLSTLANLANSSNRPGNFQTARPMTEIRSPSLTLPPIGSTSNQSGSSARRNMEPPGLTIAVPPTPIPPAPAATVPSVAQPLLSTANKANREVEMKRVLECLPRKEICNRLLDYYFDKVEWSITLLHQNSFLRATEAFWFLSEDERAQIASPTTPASATSWGGGFRASFLPPSTNYQPKFGGRHGQKHTTGEKAQAMAEEDGVNPQWISLFLAVLCVSLERIGFYDSKTLGIVESVEDYKRQCKALYDASQSIMVLGDYLKARALETVQALVLLLHCQQAMTSMQWEAQTAVVLSVAIRLGTMMGLNKLTPEKIGQARRPGLLKRELGRRAWWNLVERDWILSPKVGNAYGVSPSINFCDLPANLGWDELERQPAFVQQQKKVWTAASSFICRIDFARITRELVDRYNSIEGVSYHQLLKYEGLLKEAISRAPPVLLDPNCDINQPDGPKQWDRLQFTLHSNYMLLNLHRPYVIASLLEARHRNEKPAEVVEGMMAPPPVPSSRHPVLYSHTLEASLRSAEAILDVLEECKAADHPGVQWWHNTIYIYTAAVVLLAERWYSEEPKPGSLEAEDADERRRKIVATIALLREQGDSIEIFAEAAAALDALLDATMSARRKARKGGIRRGMDISSVVNPVNVSSRNYAGRGTPSVVRAWIEKSSTLAAPKPPPDHTSLSTIALLPGDPLIVDQSYDSYFWARIFNLEFAEPPDVKEMFYPSEGGDHTEEEGGASAALPMSNQGKTSLAYSSAGTESVIWNADGKNNVVSTQTRDGVPSDTGIGASAIWGAISGQMGTMGTNEAWARTGEFEQLK